MASLDDLAPFRIPPPVDTTAESGAFVSFFVAFFAVLLIAWLGRFVWKRKAKGVRAQRAFEAAIKRRDRIALVNHFKGRRLDIDDDAQLHAFFYDLYGDSQPDWQQVAPKLRRLNAKSRR